MKKFISFILVVVCLCMIIPYKMQRGVFSLVSDANQVCLISDESLEHEEVEKVLCGDLVFNYCSLDFAKDKLGELSNIKGVQFEFEDKTENDILDMFKASKVYEETVDDMQIIYCFTPYYNKSVLLKDKKVNLQVAIKEDKVVAGFPLILTGY